MLQGKKDREWSDRQFVQGGQDVSGAGIGSRGYGADYSLRRGGAKKLQCQIRPVWRERLEEDMRKRICRVRRMRTLYESEAIKVVPVDEVHSAEIKPSAPEE